MTETLRPLDYRATPTELPASPVLREIDGRLVVEWPSPRPSWFACSPDVLDQLVERVNRLEDECQELDAALTGQRDDGPNLCDACDVEAADCHASIRSGSIKCCPDCGHRGDPWANR